MNEQIEPEEIQEEFKEHSKTRTPKFSPFHLKVIFFLFLFGLFIWLASSRCSSPKSPAKNFLIAMTTEWYPLQLWGKEKNMTAFCETLLHEVARREKLHLRIVESSFTDPYRKLNDDSYDGFVAIVPPFPFREELYLFSDPLYRIGPVLLVKADSPFTSLSQMDGAIIGTMRNDPSIPKISDYRTIIFTSYDEISDAFRSLDNRNIDGFIMNALPANTYIQGLYAGKFKIIEMLSNNGIRLVLRKDKAGESFMELFNKGLESFRQNGDYDALIEAWALVNTEKEVRGLKQGT